MRNRHRRRRRPSVARSVHAPSGVHDVLLGAGGDDQLIEGETPAGQTNTFYGGAGNDVIAGGAGKDIVAYDVAGVRPLVADLEVGSVIGEGLDLMTRVDGIVGSPGGDILRGSTGPDAISGAGGDDIIDGIVGDDTIDGGPGRDRLQLSEQPIGVRVDLGVGRAVGDGELVLRQVEDVFGSEHDDDLVGSPGPNTIDGLDGLDVCLGGGGTDTIRGCE